MNNGVQIIEVGAGGLTDIIQGSRPLRVNARTGVVQISTPRGLVVNSMLRKDEWAEIDRVVQESARYPLRAVSDLRGRGLIKPLGGLGSMVSQWYASSEMTGANVSMSGRGGSNRDGVDLKQDGVPVPVVFKDFDINQRDLEASRRLGDGLDTTNVAEATRVVAEALDTLVIAGNATALNGAKIYGYTNHPDRTTGTATAFGGGDWTTITNITKTVAGMINAANSDRHYGPFMIYAAQTQYNDASLNNFEDGSGETPLQRLLKMPQIAGVQMLPQLTDGEAVLVQMTREVVEWAEAMPIDVIEWTTGDGMATSFKVLSVATPLIKSRYDGKSGIVHATGC
ncbi:MAG: family 1 encapsulin nanocompartment shell protein [Dokdonella sp.]